MPDTQVAWFKLASGAWIQLPISGSSPVRRTIANIPRISEWLSAIQWVRLLLQRSAAHGASKSQLLQELDNMACGAHNQETFLRFSYNPSDAWLERQHKEQREKSTCR